MIHELTSWKEEIVFRANRNNITATLKNQFSLHILRRCARLFETLSFLFLFPFFNPLAMFLYGPVYISLFAFSTCAASVHGFQFLRILPTVLSTYLGKRENISRLFEKALQTRNRFFQNSFAIYTANDNNAGHLRSAILKADHTLFEMCDPSTRDSK